MSNLILSTDLDAFLQADNKGDALAALGVIPGSTDSAILLADGDGGIKASLATVNLAGNVTGAGGNYNAASIRVRDDNTGFGSGTQNMIQVMTNESGGAFLLWDGVNRLQTMGSDVRLAWAAGTGVGNGGGPDTFLGKVSPGCIGTPSSIALLGTPTNTPPGVGIAADSLYSLLFYCAGYEVARLDSSGVFRSTYGGFQVQLASDSSKLVLGTSGDAAITRAGVGVIGVPGLSIGGGAAIVGMLSAIATIDFNSLIMGGTGSADANVTVTGAVPGDSVILGTPSGLTANDSTHLFAWVISPDVVAIRCVVPVGSTPMGSSTYRVTVLKF